jgi:2-oxoisovalerate dehydrogenase E2 component (dihydrolipoyl transacylase)
MKVFKLPDLGEGLPDAEIVEWLVQEGDEVKLDQPLVSMETAKAVVEVPSPYTGRVSKFHGQAGDVIQTGAPLVEFQVEGEDDAPSEEVRGDELAADEDRSAEASLPADSEQAAAVAPAPAQPESDNAPAAAAAEERADTGTVVGNVQSSNEVLQERTSSIGGVKVTPAVRALARKLKVDIAQVQPSGADGVVTAGDVRKAAEEGTAAPAARPAAQPEQRTEPEARREAAPAAAPQPAPATPSGDWEPIRGTRRTMARVMSESHKSVVPTTLMDDADIHAWRPGEDITARLLRALWAGAMIEPGLNAWYDGDNSMRMIHKNMHVGMAVDTPDGLFVAALRNVNKLDRPGMRDEINRLRENATNRSIPPEDLKDYTIILSNFGKFAGRYATPVITPPCVAIVAAGALRHEVVPVLGGVEVHRQIPLSLTFDHRACTGGEAARFLKAMLDDLAKAE